MFVKSASKQLFICSDLLTRKCANCLRFLPLTCGHRWAIVRDSWSFGQVKARAVMAILNAPQYQYSIHQHSIMPFPPTNAFLQSLTIYPVSSPLHLQVPLLTVPQRPSAAPPCRYTNSTLSSSRYPSAHYRSPGPSGTSPPWHRTPSPEMRLLEWSLLRV